MPEYKPPQDVEVTILVSGRTGIPQDYTVSCDGTGEQLRKAAEIGEAVWAKVTAK